MGSIKASITQRTNGAMKSTVTQACGMLRHRK
jgi:hypothetical protein